jgi:hypothetical protein
MKIENGDLVYLDSQNLPLSTPQKFTPKRVGPFEVLKKVGEASYKLRLPEQWRIHPVFHDSHLTPFIFPSCQTQKRTPPPTPELIDGELQYEVEAIISHRNRGRGRQFLVKWKSYPHEENSWQSERILEEDVPGLLHAYQSTMEL